MRNLVSHSRTRWQHIDSVLQGALPLGVEARGAYLDKACRGDCDLRREVESYLQIDQQATHSFLNAPPAEPLIPEQGRRIGPYRVLEALDGGGMAQVVLAERAEGGFEQRVVIKMLPFYMNAHSWIERFQQEQLILGRLKHPSIARIIDGGVTEAQQPYFVLEFIDGLRIDQFCHERALDLPQRLQLVAQVCDAVHFAHRNLIVHRDLKPSNILVTESGEPRLLDFGIAKILGDNRPDLTDTGRPVLTPQYAAPEQVQSQAITTATDVYALGVLLFELLTGKRPYDLSDISLGELERRICRHDPPLPSRAHELAELPSSPWAGPFGTPDSRLGTLQGDLDAIVLQALAKDPAARYASCLELATDLRNVLEHRPVTARPQTRVYRLQKWVRRHAVACGVAASVALAVVANSVFVWHQSSKLDAQKEKTRLEQQQGEQLSGFLLELIDASDPEQARGEPPSVLEVLERSSKRILELDSQPAMQARLRENLAAVYSGLGRYPEAQHHLLESLAFHQTRSEHSPMTARLMQQLADVYNQLADYEKAEPLAEKAVELQRTFDEPVVPELVDALDTLAGLRASQGDFEEAHDLWAEALRLARNHAWGPSTRVAELRHQLAFAQSDLGRLDLAVQGLLQALRMFELSEGTDHPSVGTVLNDLGGTRRKQGRLPEAVDYLRRSWELRRKVLGDDHPRTLKTLTNLGSVLTTTGRHAEAEPILRQTLDARIAIWGEQHPQIVVGKINLAYALERLDRVPEAETLFRQALETSLQVYPADSKFRTFTHTYLAALLYRNGELKEAEELLRYALDERRRLLGREHTRTADAQLHLGSCLRRSGRLDEAEQHLLQAKAVLENGPNPGHHRDAVRELVAVYTAQGRTEDARALDSVS